MKHFLTFFLALAMLLSCFTAAFADALEWSCPNCGTANTWNFCPKCGTARPSASSEAEALQTEDYSCDYFTVTKPIGWEVSYTIYDSGNGRMRLFVFITDPDDCNNMIFFMQGLEPFFPDLATKNAVLPYVDSRYEWSPVLSEDLDAENVLKNWASIYTLMEIEGSLEQTQFKNYLVKSVLQTYNAGMSGGAISSGVLAEVSIPAASSKYGMYFENTLKPSVLESTSYIYYISYSNLGFVANPKVFNSSASVLMCCKNSFDFSDFQRCYTKTAHEFYPSVFDELGEFTIE